MKKYVNIIIILSVAIVISIASAIFAFVSISKSTIKNLYYKNTVIYKNGSEYSIEGYVVNNSKLVFSTAYVDVTFSDALKNEAVFQMYLGNLDNKVGYFKYDISSIDIDFERNPYISKVCIKEGFEGDSIEIYSLNYLNKNHVKIYFLFYILLSDSAILVIVLLLVLNAFSRYQHKIHYVTMAKNKNFALNNKKHKN